MIINLRESIGRGKILLIEQTVDIAHLAESQKEIIEAKPLDIQLKVSYAPGRVVVNGELSTDLLLVCSRCLNHFKEQLTIPFIEIFTNLPETAYEDEVNYHQVQEDQTELMPYIEENVILAFPFVPLCSSSCLGLCATCGINLNERTCLCSKETLDPRLEGLKDFFTKE